MKATLAVVDKLHGDGIIGPYAVGGAVGAAFHRPFEGPMNTLLK